MIFNIFYAASENDFSTTLSSFSVFTFFAECDSTFLSDESAPLNVNALKLFSLCPDLLSWNGGTY